MQLSKKQYLMIAVTFILTFAIAFVLPTFGQVTPFGMKILGVFVGVMFAWIFVDLTWGSIFGFLMIGILGLTTVTEALSNGLGDKQFIILFTAMCFAVATNQMGATDAIANVILKQPIFQKSPWALILGMFLVDYIISAIGPGMAIMFLLWSLSISICKHAGYDSKSPIYTWMIYMLTIISFMANLTMPFRGTVILYSSYLVQVAGPLNIPFVTFILVATVVMAAIFSITGLISKILLRVDVSKFMLPEEEIKRISAIKMSTKDKVGISILIVYILALTLPDLLPQLPGMTFLKQLGIPGMSIAAIIIAALLKFDGKAMINISSTLHDVDWGLMFLVAVTFPLTALMRHADAGIMPTAFAYVQPIVEMMGVTAFILVITLILGLLTQVTHNIALAAMFVPFVCPLVASMGGDMVASWFMLFIMLNCAYMTPAASMPAALIFGHELSNTKYCYLMGITLYFVAAIVLSIGYPIIATII